MRIIAPTLAVLLALAAFTLPACEQAPSSGPDAAAAWADHMGKVPFTVGYTDGVAAAKASGRPMMFFHTAHW